mgnify:FL=1
MIKTFFNLFVAFVGVNKNLYHYVSNNSEQGKNETFFKNRDVRQGACEIPETIDTLDQLHRININYHKHKLLKTLENPNVSDYDKVLLIEEYDILNETSYGPNIAKGLDWEGFDE